MTIRPGNAQHQGARDDQQDSFAFSDLEDRAFVAHGGVLAVISDGMGGLAHGGDAGVLAVRTFLHRYQSKAADESIPLALAAALQRANEVVVDLARSSGEPGNVGATLVAAVVHDRRLHWTSVGDSRAYLMRGHQLEQVTVDHVYGAELDLKRAAGTVSEEAARNDMDRDALTSHLGKEQLTLVDCSVHPLPLESGDRVLLCTDGLYRALTAEEIASNFSGDPQLACEELVDRVVQKRLPRQDNITATALALDGAGLLPSGDDTEAAGAPAQSRTDRRYVSALLVVVLLTVAGVWWRLRHDPDSTQPTVRLPSTATRPNTRPAGERGTRAQGEADGAPRRPSPDPK